MGENSAPVFANLDSDADLELVIGESDGALKYYDLSSGTWTEKTSNDNPFNSIDVGDDSIPSFANLDSDADLELVIGESNGTLAYYDLSSGSWTEKTGNNNPFNSIDVGEDSAPVFAHLDDDADLELAIGESDGTLKYYDLSSGTWTEKTGSDNPFNGIDVGANSVPVFANLDIDARLELVIGESKGALAYYDRGQSGSWTEKTGDDNPFNGIDVGSFAVPVFFNLDSDADSELVIGENGGTLKYYDLSSGTWTAKTGNDNPFNGIDVGSYSAPTFANLDTDTDLELVIGESGGGLKYYDLSSGTWTEKTGSNNPFNGISTSGLSTAIFANFDSDANLELLVGGEGDYLDYYDLSSGVWTEKTGNNNPFSINTGDLTHLSVANLDSDTDLELLVGLYDEPFGTMTNHPPREHGRENMEPITPSTALMWDTTPLQILSTSTPMRMWSWSSVRTEEPSNTTTYPQELGRTRQPSEILLVALTWETMRSLLWAISTPMRIWSWSSARAEEPSNTMINPLGPTRKRRAMTTPSTASMWEVIRPPVLANLDSDTDLELVIGESGGTLKYYDLTSGTWTEKTGANNPFNGIDVGSNSIPVFANLDSDTDLELVIGESGGTFKYYDLSSGTWTEKTGANNPFNGIDAGANSAPAFTNLDSDADLELVIGESGGTFKYYDLSSGTWTAKTGANNPFSGIDVGSNSVPTFANLDSDADLELVIGESGGTLLYMDNYYGNWNLFIK